MADDWSGTAAPDLIGAVITGTARPQPERQAQSPCAPQNANIGFRQVATIAALATIEIQRRSDRARRVDEFELEITQRLVGTVMCAQTCGGCDPFCAGKSPHDNLLGWLIC